MLENQCDLLLGKIERAPYEEFLETHDDRFRDLSNECKDMLFFRKLQFENLENDLKDCKFVV